QSSPRPKKPPLERNGSTSEKEKQEKSKKAKTAASTGILPCSMEELLCRRAMLLAGVSLILCFLLTPSFTINTVPYSMGDIADRNIKAKRDFTIEDTQATSKRREDAVRQTLIISDLDENTARQTLNKVATAFLVMREHMEATPAVPERTLLPMIEPGGLGFTPLTLPGFQPQATSNKKDFETLLGIQVPDEVFANLSESRFCQDVETKLSKLLEAAFEQGIVSDKAWLLQTQRESIVVRKTGVQDEILMPPPHTFPDLEEARKLVRMQALEQGKDVKEMMAIAFLVPQLLLPNLTFNLEETQHRREQAYASVKPVQIKIMKNEMLVREGQRIGPEEMIKLRAHEQGNPVQHWFIVSLTMFLFSGLSIWLVAQVAKEHLPSFKMELEDLIFLAIVLVFLLTIGRSTMWIADLVGDNPAGISGKTFLYAVPLSAGAMMACIFFGVTVSLIFSLLLTIFAAMLFGRDFGLFFYFLMGSFVAAHGVANCKNRMVPIKAGLIVGCVNIVLIALSALLQDQWIFLRVLTNAFFGFCGGIFAGILVTGFTPLAEMAFGYTTDVRLLELATMDQPLLQELMLQAPGTYHHCIIVGNMVEAAAKSIGANSLLAKVAAYYHDIGKIRKPIYFIENQVDCENRHEKLAPSMSSLILISHVKEGAELARQHRLGREIIDIISQHHGKSFISFFYKKALEAREKAQTTKGAGLPPINMDDYRYPGPKPQTKEAGLVMLADVVEAACRSLTDPTPARIQGMVHRLINNIFTDGQLDECELTLKDLHHIAKRFNQILATVHHRRIEYPSSPHNDGKAKTDGSDSNQREPRQDKDKSGPNRESGRADLKRLGIH
ncbi:MAG: HD family phosphohydrolase, partial [Acidobacteriota bacterium]